jgi:GNAT superfamily N-acetyltransferase
VRVPAGVILTEMIRDARPRDVPAILTLVRALARYEREPDAVVEMTEADLDGALFGPRPTAWCLVAVTTVAAGGHRARGPADLPEPVDPVDPVDEQIAGFAIWHPTFSTWTGRSGIFLVDLFVQPEHRRDGHGRALLTGLAAICRRRGYARLEWNVLEWNTPAQAFYRTLGACPLDGWSTWRLDETAILALTAGEVTRFGALPG